MLQFLFGRLTRPANPGQAAFGRLVSEARQPHWYVAGAVPDTLNGRFAMLATVCALAIVRLEMSDGESGGSAALTERFIEAMDSEHRELGLNDPGLGRRVRKLVGALARRVEAWRLAISGEESWDGTLRSSLGPEASPEALAHCSVELRGLWTRMCAASAADVLEGRF